MGKIVISGFVTMVVLLLTPIVSLQPKAINSVGRVSSPFARCWCSVRVNGTEVDKLADEGYSNPQKNKCKKWCETEWDNSGNGSNSQIVAWAKMLSGACGDVTVSMHAAVGTQSYDQVRSAVMSTGVQCQPSWGETHSSSSDKGALEAKASSDKIELKWLLNHGTITSSPKKIGICTRVTNPGILHVCRNNVKYTIDWDAQTNTTQVSVLSNKNYWVGVILYTMDGNKYFLGDTIKIKTQ